MPDLRIGETRGDALVRGGWEIRPIGRVARLVWLGGRLEWHRPIAVELRRGERHNRVPIHDVTRRALAAFLLADVALGILGVSAARRYPRRRVRP